MNFGQLVEEAIVLTGRPDLVAEHQLQVRKATLFLHMYDFWIRDRLEKKLLYNTAASAFMVDVPAQFKNWRKFMYIRKWDEVSSESGAYIKRVDPDKMFDEFEAKKTDVYYVSGNKLNIKASENLTGFLVGWYTFPNVTDQYFSWIAEMHPYAIIDYAAGQILQIIGKVEEANKLLDKQKGTVYTDHLPGIYRNEIEEEAR